MANLSKIKRDRMLEYLKRLKETNNDDESIRAITEIENALNEKKYGLVWEEHSEKVDEMAEHNIPIFIENKERKIVVNEDAYNFLLEVVVLCQEIVQNKKRKFYYPARTSFSLDELDKYNFSNSLGDKYPQ